MAGAVLAHRHAVRTVHLGEASWSAATDPNGVANYALYENGKPLATVSGSTLTFTATGLPSGVTTTFAVQAIDPSSAPTWNGPTASYVATSTAAGPLVQHVSGSNLRNNSMASPFCYDIELPAPAQAGNAVVVGATWKGSATLSVTDDLGDKYAVESTFHDATDNQSVGIASSFGVAAGARKLAVCFSADPGGWVEPMATGARGRGRRRRGGQRRERLEFVGGRAGPEPGRVRRALPDRLHPGRISLELRGRRRVLAAQRGHTRWLGGAVRGRHGLGVVDRARELAALGDRRDPPADGLGG